MLYVADVVWPAKSNGGTAQPLVVAKGTDIGRFGHRASGFVGKCTPNADPDGDGMVDWYSAETR